MSSKRSFLLLQGVASPFFNELEKKLLAKHQLCLKINFCGGDLFSGGFFLKAQNYLNYQGTLDALPVFYKKIFKQQQITDIALFGDTRPVHLPAIALAKEHAIKIHVYEEGYFRPNWVTLDQAGVNANSQLFKQANHKPKWFLEHASAANWQDRSAATGGNILTRGWYDIRYHLAKGLFKAKFPHYKTHRPDSPLAEYWGFLRRMPMLKLYYNQQSNRRIAQLLKSKMPYYLLPLQLQADSQMRLHSSFKSLTQVIETTLKSFSNFAAKDTLLVIKLHPLDPWFIDYQKAIKAQMIKFSIDENRIIYLEAGNLEALLKDCHGTVLVNSTVGTSALAKGCPVIALGKAIYDIAGLTFQGSLDEFWQHGKAPDKALFEAFRQCYISRTQINGSFYNRKGIEMAVDASVKKLLETKIESLK